MVRQSKTDRRVMFRRGEVVPDVFWSRVERGADDACWPWQGARTTAGYGRAGAAGARYAHRVAYELARGPIAPGLFVCHRCDNPPCCNPAHLFAGTHAENMRDAIAKRRHFYGAHPHRIRRGGAVNTAKLTPSIVREMRARFDSGESASAIARAYGVSRASVQRIGRRESWRHVNDNETAADDGFDIDLVAVGEEHAA